MKQKRPRLQLSDEQQLALSLLLVILLAISLLYCLGFASLALRETWENTDLPWTTPETGQEILDVTPEIVTPATPLPSPTPLSLLHGVLENWPAFHPLTPRAGTGFDRTVLRGYNLHAAEHACSAGTSCVPA